MNFRFINKSFLPFSILLLVISTQVAAEEPVETPSLPEPAYITPENMTKEDQIMLSDYSGSYNGCLMETSIDQMNQQTDARHIVDFAMKQCAVKMEELNQKMIERNFEPNFRQGYIHRISNQGANNALQNVMMGMAARQSQESMP